MPSLTSCIKKAGPLLRPEDKAIILARAAALRSEGATNAEASARAVEERRDDVRALLERAEATRLKGGDAAKGKAQNVAQEPDAPYEVDLFGQAVPQASRRPAARPRPGQAAGNLQPAAGVPGDTPAPDGEYLVRTVVGRQVERELGATSVRNAAEAAAATRYLYRSAVERFDGIVVNAAGKPLAVVGGFKGALAETTIHPSTLVGEAVRVPGAAAIWFSHNHPSGTPGLSAADRRLFAVLSDALKGSGIEPKGILAIGDGSYGALTSDGFNETIAPIPASRGTTRVPVVEREQIPSTDALAYVNSPSGAKDLAQVYYGRAKVPGLVLLNQQHAVVAWVPLPTSTMGDLRGTGGLNAIYRAVSEANAGAAILVHGGELDQPRRIAGGITIGQNIGAALAKLDVRVLDQIDARTMTSAAERGASLASGPVFSRSKPTVEARAGAAIARYRGEFASTPSGLDMAGFRDFNARRRAAKEQLTKDLLALANQGDGLLLPTRSGNSFIALHRDPRTEGAWRTTTFTKDMEPAGHMEFKRPEEAAEGFADMAAGAPTAGEDLLSTQTEADLRAKAAREAAGDKADAAEQKRLADKARADAMRDEFVLTGSDRPADAAGQGTLFSRGGVWQAPASPSPDEARAWASGVARELGLQAFDVWPNGRGDLTLNLLVVPRGARKAGLGSEAMRRLVEYADSNALRVVLSPARQDDAHGTTSSARLVKFYRRFGFVENKGRHKDFTISESMMREPQPRFSRGRIAEQLRAENFRRWSGGAPLVTSAEAVGREWLTGEPVVVEAFHGTARPDRIGDEFKPARATSGPMSFFTSDPEVASSYAQNKRDTSLAYEDQNYESWFKFKPPGERTAVDIVRAWYRLSPEQKARVAALAPRVTFDMEGDGIVLGPEGHNSGTGSYDYNLEATKRSFDRVGNPMKALLEDWLNSGKLINDESEFLKVLKLAGFPVEHVDFDNPNAQYPAVIKGHIAFANPLVTSDMPQRVLEALREAAKRDRTRTQPNGGDIWDKNSRSIRDWLDAFGAEGAEYVWTSIPDKVTAVLRGLGYDGIIDTGGKGGGLAHRVFIPFAPTQFKGAFNKGTYDPEKRRFNFSRAGDAANGLGEQRVRRLVDEIRDAWANAPEVVVVSSMRDERVPAAARAADAAQRSQGAAGDPRGFFFGGKTYIVAGAMRSAADVAETLLHESLGHFGLRGTFGAALDPVLDRLALLNGSAVRQKAQEYGLDVADRAQRRIAAEEVLAELAQTRPELGIVQRAIAAIRAWLREHLPMLMEGRDLSDAEIIREYIEPARMFVEAGADAAAERLDDITAFARPAAPFFSALERGVDALRSAAAPAAGWRDAIRGLVSAGKVKADEVEWSGINEWLDLQQGKVTKEQVLEYLRENGARVEETMLGFRPGVEARRNDLMAQIRARGFDVEEDSYGGPASIVNTKNGVEYQYAPDEEQFTDEDAVLRPEQIKSATGNRGTFDPNDPDVRFSRAEPQASPELPLTGGRAAPPPAARPGWLDATNRVQFKPGAWLYAALGRAATPLLNRLQLKAASPEMRRHLRRMKLDIAKAQETAVEVARDMRQFNEGDRLMVSDIIERELDAGVAPPEHAVRLAAVMNQSMGEQSRELVRLGMLSEETAGRWEGAYLPRFYESKLSRKVGDAWADAVRRITGRPGVMKGIKGQHLKGRGLYETVPEAELEHWKAMGWEVRDPDYQPGLPATDGTVQVWRDYTRVERERMGEIRDAGFRFVMGYMQTQRDIALGRLFEALASDEQMSSRTQREGWIRVPDSTVDGAGGVRRYGKLAGRFVSPDVLSQLTGLDEAQSAAWQFYRKALGIWKMGKTSMNPVSHMNNVLSNLTMAHFAGVGYHRADKYIGALRDFIAGADGIKEAKEAGLFLGTMNAEELVKDLPAELREVVAKGESATMRGARLTFDLMTFFLRKPLGAAYEAEDLFFRYLIYKDARGRGLEPQAAVDHAQRYIFTYDDLPKGARLIRDFGLPFFGYTYKAIPALLNTALAHPHRMAAPAAVLWAANAFAYAIATDDDDDWQEALRKFFTDDEFRKRVQEKQSGEREHLPPWMKGTTALFTPKAIRLGMDEVTELPLFLDVARIIPGGDLFDVSPNAGGIPLPQPITPSHPIFSIATAMLANKDLWTGKDLVMKGVDTDAEAAQKRAEWVWRQLAPATAIGNYHWERTLNALAQATGQEIQVIPGAPEAVSKTYTGVGRDGQPVQPAHAAMQTFGIKVRPIDLDLSEKIDASNRERLIRDIDNQLRGMRRLNAKGAISDKAMDEAIERSIEKKTRLREGLTVDGNKRD